MTRRLQIRKTPGQDDMATFERAIPILVYQDIAAAHDFLVNVFGFESGGVVRDNAGQVVHAEVHIGPAEIWLHRVTAEHNLEAASDVASSGLFVYVDDVNAHFQRVRAAGARVDGEPVDQPYGQREYGARDSEGHRWWFATPTTE
jgi:MerR family transcriptional regulator, thiopeptide resistance regulator